MAILDDRTALTTPATGDLYMTTDVSDTTDAATGTDKKITFGNIVTGIGSATKTLTNTTIDADGTGNSITNIENADIKAAAAIALNKLAALTASEIVITDASGFMVSGAVATYPSLTELTYVKGVTSAIQTQLDAKGTGDVSKVGTPVDSQIGVWTGDGTIEGDADLTFDTAGNTLAIAGAAGTSTVAIGGANILVDSPRGTMTLSNIDALDATTEATIEAAIDTLANLTSAASLVTVGTLTTGNADAIVSAASTTTAGKVELATTAETDTGTDTGRAVTPDGLAGSYAGEKIVQVTCFDYTTDTAVGDGAGYFHIPSGLNGMNLVEVHAEVITAGTTGTTDIQIANVTQAADMLTTKITIDSAETGSDTAATPAVIDTANDDVATNDLIRIDVDAVSTTAAKGLIVTCVFQLP